MRRARDLREQINRPIGERHTDDRAKERDEETFGQHLPNDAASGSRQARRGWPAPCARNAARPNCMFITFTQAISRTAMTALSMAYMICCSCWPVKLLISGWTLAETRCPLVFGLSFAIRIAKDNPKTNEHLISASVQSLHKTFTGQQLTQIMYAMLGAVIVVLLIACVNVMNMQFGRAALRSRELAIAARSGRPAGASSGKC